MRFQHRAPWWLAYLAIALVIAVGGFGYWWVHSTNHYLNMRRGISDQKNAATASEQASTRLLVCTGLEALPQTVGVRALESILYPIYKEPTKPYCPAPMPGATK